ncbi:MAG: beta-propeller fold lactonase family protein [Planctomycetaceae bacterium]
MGRIRIGTIARDHRQLENHSPEWHRVMRLLWCASRMQFRLHQPPGILTVALLLLYGNCLRACGDSFVFVSLLQERKIVTFSRHVETGELVRQHDTICPAEPAFLAASNDGKVLFVSLRSSGQLAAYRIDSANGTLTLINTVDGGDDPAFLVTDRSGKFLLTAYYVSNKVTVHQIASSGRISESPVQSLATAANAHGIAIDSKNETVYVSHTGANRIYQFSFDAATGRLTPLDPPFVSAKAGQHPRHIVLHPSDNWAYCSNEAGNSEEDGASMYNRNAVSKSLSLSQSSSSVPDDFDANKNSTARCLITPNGRFLYVANRGHDSIAGYEIDKMSGQLTQIAVTPTEAVPRSFTITPDGRHLYVAGEASGRVAGYRTTVAGKLEPVSTIESGPVSWAILAVDPQRLSPAGM